MRKLLIATLAALPLVVLAATPENRHAGRAEHDLRAVSNHGQKSLEKVPGVSAVKVDFDKKPPQSPMTPTNHSRTR